MKKVLELLAVVVVTASLYVGCLSEDPYTVALPDIVAVETGSSTQVDDTTGGSILIDPPIIPIPSPDNPGPDDPDTSDGGFGHVVPPPPPCCVPWNDPPPLDTIPISPPTPCTTCYVMPPCTTCVVPPDSTPPEPPVPPVPLPDIKPPSPVYPNVDWPLEINVDPIVPPPSPPVEGCQGGGQNGNIPIGTAEILRSVVVNSGTIISGGAAIITVNSSVELTQLNMQIEGVARYNVFCLGRVTPFNGVYTYTLTVDITQNLGTGRMRMLFTGRSASQLSTLIVVDVGAISVGSGNLQVSLSWNNRDDLDLHIQTPSGGHIYFANKSVGNGRLDMDANVGCGNLSNENIYFNGTLADGTYRVWVNLYSKCGTAGAQYSVTASSGGRVFTFSRDGLSESGRFADSDSYGKNKVIGFITVRNGNIVPTDYAALERQGLLKQPVNSQREPKK